MEYYYTTMPVDDYRHSTLPIHLSRHGHGLGIPLAST